MLCIPEQDLDVADLETCTFLSSPFGEYPFFKPIKGSKHVVATARAANETEQIFAETWHSDWSFHMNPPAHTFLYEQVVQPIGGDTHFINQQAAFAAPLKNLRGKIKGLNAVYSVQ